MALAGIPCETKSIFVDRFCRDRAPNMTQAGVARTWYCARQTNGVENNATIRRYENNLAEIPVVVQIPGFCCSTGTPPLLGSPLGCFLISLSRRFIPPRLSDEHSIVNRHSAQMSPLFFLNTTFAPRFFCLAIRARWSALPSPAPPRRAIPPVRQALLGM